MSFFYSTPAGAVDFAALIAVGAFGLIVGRGVTREMAATVVISFLAQRIGLALDFVSWVITVGITSCAMALFLETLKGRIAAAMATIFWIMAIVTIATPIVGVSFSVPVLTVAFYLQCLLILGRGANDASRRFDDYNDRRGRSRFSRLLANKAGNEITPAGSGCTDASSGVDMPVYSSGH